MGRPKHRNYETKSERRERNRSGPTLVPTRVPYNDNKKELIPLTPRQGHFINSINVNTLSFGIGYAGTGKTHVALAVAVTKLLNKEIEQIVLTKPDFEIDEKLGTLPGDENEKTAPRFRPMVDILVKLLGRSRYEYFVKSGKIKLEPLGNILGTTFDDAIIIIDESQNTTPGQMFAVISRLGKRSKIIVIGDYYQQKFVSGRCGLEDALVRFMDKKEVGITNFLVEDIVREDFVKTAVLAYRETADFSKLNLIQ